jgi:hypothetical protein
MYSINENEVNICDGNDCNLALLKNKKLFVEDNE